MFQEARVPRIQRSISIFNSTYIHTYEHTVGQRHDYVAEPPEVCVCVCVYVCVWMRDIMGDPEGARERQRERGDVGGGRERERKGEEESARGRDIGARRKWVKV